MVNTHQLACTRSRMLRGLKAYQTHFHFLNLSHHLVSMQYPCFSTTVHVFLRNKIGNNATKIIQNLHDGQKRLS